MKAFSGMDFWGAMALPVPIRKWLIKRHNKFMEQTSSSPPRSQNQNKPLPSSPPSDEPLNQAQKAKMRNQIAQVQSDPGAAMSAFHKGVTTK